MAQHYNKRRPILVGKSGDLSFTARRRPCVHCQKIFLQSSQRRLFCSSCFQHCRGTTNELALFDFERAVPEREPDEVAGWIADALKDSPVEGGT